MNNVVRCRKTKLGHLTAYQLERLHHTLCETISTNRASIVLTTNIGLFKINYVHIWRTPIIGIFIIGMSRDPYI